MFGDLAKLVRKGQRAVRSARRVVAAVERGAVDAREVARGITAAADAAQTAVAAAHSALGGVEATLTRSAAAVGAGPRIEVRPAAPPTPRTAPVDAEVVEAEVVEPAPKRPRFR